MNIKNKGGFTFVELVIVMGILVILMMIVSVNFFPIKQRTSLSTTVFEFITDLKQTQLKAMSGEASQGIYFSPDQKNYIIFKGATYDPSNTTNFNVPLGDQITVTSIDFSGRQLIFSPGGGEISNYLPGNKITLLNSVSNEQKSIIFNKYGTITSVE
jgi:prepilin-type N-terminal cleavage/methylation domain-containing protein